MQSVCLFVYEFIRDVKQMVFFFLMFCLMFLTNSLSVLPLVNFSKKSLKACGIHDNAAVMGVLVNSISSIHLFASNSNVISQPVMETVLFAYFMIQVASSWVYEIHNNKYRYRGISGPESRFKNQKLKSVRSAILFNGIKLPYQKIGLFFLLLQTSEIQT